MLSYFVKKTLKKHDENNNRKILSAVMSANFRAQALAGDSVGVGNHCPESIVVSFTSFPRRIDDVYLTVESLFQQSLKADKIILWLSLENFPTRDLPRVLRMQEERGLQIEFREGDLGPYKKIVYAAREHPESLIITVDDDVLYPIDMIDQLYRAYLRNPGEIYAHRAYKMQLLAEKRLASYADWAQATDQDDAALIFPTGIAGVLYSPQVFNEEFFNQDAFMRLCPNADDIWLKAMALHAGSISRFIGDGRPWKDRFLMIGGSQVESLKKQNWNAKSGNDQKLKAVFDHYDLYSRLQ